MKAPPFAKLRMHFLDSESVPAGELYQFIGYPENIENANFENTCAIRMSLALLGAGFPNPGMYPVKAGKYKGRMIETKQRYLSTWLVKQLGQPEKFKSGLEARDGIGARRGIVSFFQIHGDERQQGHIAIVTQDQWGHFRCGNETPERAAGCYWTAVEVWFWPFP